jgi:hypothetical protein
MQNKLKEIKNKIEMLLKGTNNINSLMRDRVDPYILMEEVPVPIQVGQQIIWVGNFTITNNFKFWQGYGRILALIGIDFKNFDLLVSGQDLFKKLMAHKKLYKELLKLIHKTICKQQSYYLEQFPNITKRKLKKWKNCSLKYFINHMTIEKLLQICRIVYMYNFSSEKKNLEILLFQLPQEGKAIMGSYMSSYLENMVGLIGKFQLAHTIKPSDLSAGETILDNQIKAKDVGNEKKN